MNILTSQGKFVVLKQKFQQNLNYVLKVAIKAYSIAAIQCNPLYVHLTPVYI